MPTIRAFIAIDINATPSMVEFEQKISKVSTDVKLVELQNIHITLKFLGDVEERDIDNIEQAIKDSVKGIGSFQIELKGTGVFPNQNYMKVVWIGITDGAIPATIAHTIDEKLAKLGFKKEQRGFSSHLTIGRVKTAKNKQLLLQTVENYADVTFGIQEVHAIKLKKSDLTPKGPIYTTMREVPLQK